MNKAKAYSMIQALLAAALFGASAPLSKILLGHIEPIPLAAFLYLGSGVGMILYRLAIKIIKKNKDNEAPLIKKDYPWLLGAVIFGGVIAPIILMYSLKITPASTAALLLNFESIATTIIAAGVFKEAIGKRSLMAILFITAASIILSWDFSNQWGLSIGTLGILAACICWGIDNNFTRNISSKNPFTIVTIKGFGAGFFSLILTLITGSMFPSIETVVKAMLLGCFSYGFSIVLFVLAMRNLGSARTSALFGTSPFIGVILAFILLREIPTVMFLVSLPIMIFGTVLLLKEEHCHKHIHEATIHEHRHCHEDNHHDHVHLPGEIPANGYHSHVHEHKEIEHEHQHMPDIHHRHTH
ncbi:DMT family transporter [Clostridium omnivorum]|uniref:Membrane protein n=1 Tax=Clostridium omnivorum TaxID=1604902 RepID=A0ABQ5N277_9CLOT|nr:DMT family transporter [Clostridium sp. E14]GLC29271.1 membrane protein [Clostridium sp. E14]